MKSLKFFICVRFYKSLYDLYLKAGNESSPISAIFRGQICCVLHQLGQKESATLQPFFTLKLDIQVLLNCSCKSFYDAVVMWYFAVIWYQLALLIMHCYAVSVFCVYYCG